MWRSLHEADPERGSDVATLLARLSRALADPGYRDPHPWVEKGRRFFDAGIAHDGEPFADPVGLRRAASQLGNDLGQMRVRFDARACLPAPGYRDDNGHLWRDAASEDSEAGTEMMLEIRTPPGSRTDGSEVSNGDGRRHPEWDRLIRAHRRDWVVVREAPLRPSERDDARERALADAFAALQGVTDALGRALRRLDRERVLSAGRRVPEGDRLDLDALVASRIAQLRRSTPDPRVFRSPCAQRRRIAVAVLVDASASTSAVDAAGRTVLSSELLAAGVIARALEACGHACAIHAFRSNGRLEVLVHPVKPFRVRAGDPSVLGAMGVLESRWSTRLGAAVRHAVAGLERMSVTDRCVLLLTDGEPRDVDVHDPAYLAEDLRMAIAQAERAGVAVGCALLAAGTGMGLRRAFRGERLRRIPRPENLAMQAGALMASLVR